MPPNQLWQVTVAIILFILGISALIIAYVMEKFKQIDYILADMERHPPLSPPLT